MVDLASLLNGETKRKTFAQMLAEQSMSTAPTAGGWGAGLARALQGGLAGYYDNQDKQALTDQKKQRDDLIASYPGANPAQSAAPAAIGKALMSGSDTSGKIYSNNEPSPLDPPSGADRTNMIATILGEAGNQGPQGMQAVGSVIRNRAVDGGYGGDTPTGVVQAPKQFEPWNTPEGRAKMASALSNPQQVAAADNAIRMAYGEGGKAPDDPTEGMTHFYSPSAQAALGRPAPSWAKGENTKIGDHVFYSPDDSQASAFAPNAVSAVNSAAAGQPQQFAQNGDARRAWAIRALQSSDSTVQAMGQKIIDETDKPPSYSSAGNGYILNSKTGEAKKGYEPDNKFQHVTVGDRPGSFDPSTGQYSFQKNGLPDPGVDTSTLTGDDFLKALPRGEADIVRKIAEYDIDPKSLSTKGGHREDLLKKVSQYDPDYSEPLYTSRKAAIKEFGAGGTSSPAGQITAGNTAILHAGEMSDALESLKKKNSGPLGYIGQSGIPFASYYAQKAHNAGITGTGTDEARALSDFRTAKNHFSEEVTKFYAGSGGSEAERERALSNIDEAKSLPELQSAIQQEARLMGGKINTLQDRIKTAMGPSAWKRAMKEAGGQFPIVQQQSADQLSKIEKRAAGKETVIDGYTIREH